jgi:hypothetical protein
MDVIPSEGTSPWEDNDGVEEQASFFRKKALSY